MPPTPHLLDPERQGPERRDLLEVRGLGYHRQAHDARRYEEIVGVAQAVRMSDRDWTIVGVPLLSDGPGSEEV